MATKRTSRRDGRAEPTTSPRTRTNNKVDRVFPATPARPAPPDESVAAGLGMASDVVGPSDAWAAATTGTKTRPDRQSAEFQRRLASTQDELARETEQRLVDHAALLKLRDDHRALQRELDEARIDLARVAATTPAPTTELERDLADNVTRRMVAEQRLGEIVAERDQLAADLALGQTRWKAERATRDARAQEDRDALEGEHRAALADAARAAAEAGETALASLRAAHETELDRRRDEHDDELDRLAEIHEAELASHQRAAETELARSLEERDQAALVLQQQVREAEARADALEQALATARDAERDLAIARDAHARSTAERDMAVSERAAVEAERDALVAERDGLLVERGVVTAERDAAHVARDAAARERDERARRLEDADRDIERMRAEIAAMTSRLEASQMEIRRLGTERLRLASHLEQGLVMLGVTPPPVTLDADEPDDDAP